LSNTYLICGSRDFSNPFMASIWIDAYLRSMLKRGDIVIHGNARGADRISAESAERAGCTVLAYEADWETHGKRAGIIRNLEMLDANPDMVIAFWTGKSKGTKHTISEAEKRGIHTIVIEIP
jgi:hypothetical protein